MKKDKKSVRYEFLHQFGKNRIFTKKDADDFFGYNAQISVGLIINNGLATRIRRGLYYIFNWGETTVQQHRDFFVPYIGEYIVGYWSALDHNYNKSYLLSSRKQRLEKEEIGNYEYVYQQLPASKLSYSYEKDGVRYLDKYMSFALCVLNPEFTPGTKELKKYAEENIDKEDFFRWFRKPQLKRIFKTTEWAKVYKFVDTYGKVDN